MKLTFFMPDTVGALHCLLLRWEVAYFKVPCHSSLPLPLALILHSGRGETLRSLVVSFSHLEKSHLPLSCCLRGKEQASVLCWPSPRCPWPSPLFVLGFLPSSPLMPREHLMPKKKSSDSSSLSAKCGGQIRVSGFELGSQPQTFYRII